MKYLLFSASALLLFLSCDKLPENAMEQSSQYNQWRSLNIHDYSIDQVRSCFCPFGGETVRITVRSDTIAGMIRVSDSTPVSYPYYLTVDSLFGLIRDLTTDSLVIRYNAEYGYPEFLDVNPQDHPVDGGYLYETGNLRIP